MVSNLIQKLKQNLKISQSLNIDNNSKLSKGDKVIINIYNRKPKGIIKKIDKNRISDKYQVIFNSDRGGDIWYWFSENELELDKEFYRDKKLSKIGIL